MGLLDEPVGTGAGAGSKVLTQGAQTYYAQRDPADYNNDGVVTEAEAFRYAVETGQLTPPPDDGGSGNSGYYTQGGGGGGVSLQEELELLRQKYALDTDQQLTILREQARVNNDYEIQRMVTQFNLSREQELALLAEKYRLDLSTELQLMKEKAAIDRGAAEADRDFQRIENATDREWKTLEAEEDRKWRAGESAVQREWESGMAQEERDWKSEEGALDREFQALMKGMDIEAQQSLQNARLAAEQAMQNQELTFRERIAAADRAMDKEIAGMRIDADMKMQIKELASREAIAKMEIQSQEKMQEKQFAHEKELRTEDRKMERQKMFVDMVGKDPVRAVLLAMGVSGPLLPGGEMYEDLGPLEGAEQLKANTEKALGGIEGVGQNVAITKEGVTGINPIEKQARSFVQGSTPQQTLLTSAHGLGTPTSGGLGAEDVVNRALAVTPKGYENRAAAEGEEDVQPKSVYLTGEGQNMEGTKPEALVVDENQKLQNIVPLTRPDEQVIPQGPNTMVSRATAPPIQPGVTPTAPGLPALNKFAARPGSTTVPPTQATGLEQAVQQSPVFTNIRNQMSQYQLPKVGDTNSPFIANNREKMRQEITKRTGISAPDIDLRNIGPEVLASLMNFANNPYHPASKVAKKRLAQLLPRLRAGTAGALRENNINNAAVGLAGILG